MYSRGVRTSCLLTGHRPGSSACRSSPLRGRGFSPAEPSVGSCVGARLSQAGVHACQHSTAALSATALSSSSSSFSLSSAPAFSSSATAGVLCGTRGSFPPTLGFLWRSVAVTCLFIPRRKWKTWYVRQTGRCHGGENSSERRRPGESETGASLVQRCRISRTVMAAGSRMSCHCHLAACGDPDYSDGIAVWAC